SVPHPIDNRSLPRIGRIVRSGRRRNNSAWRRNEAVPILASFRAASLGAFVDRSASRRSSRGSTQVIASPAGIQVSRSFKEYPARINMPGDQRVLDLLDEQALAADLAEQPVLHP